eukprot:Skav205179  [mRNA]  locus=scaffold1333:68743:69528:+ [translate_table: standard]
MPTVSRVSSVKEALSELKWLAEEAADAGDPNGLFFALYVLVTRQIQRGIDEKKFDNPQRMEAFDVVFANLLFDQVRLFREAGDLSKVSVESWGLFFQAKQRKDLTAAQNMFLGVGPHILHDLAVAIFKVIPEEEIDSFHRDYLRVNDLLFQALDSTQNILASKSCGMQLVDWLFCRTDEWIAMGGLALLRDQAFEGGRKLHAAKDDAAQALIVKELDSGALAFSQAVAARATFCILCSVGVPEQEKFGPIIRDLVSKAFSD